SGTNNTADKLDRTGMTNTNLTEAQPLPFNLSGPNDLTLFKSPAGSQIDFGKLLPFYAPFVTAKQPTGSYNGKITISAGGLTGETKVGLRVNEANISMLLPGRATTDPRPDFDAGRSGLANSRWVNYLTGVESWPTAAAMSLGIGLNDLGVWVASNTPQAIAGSTQDTIVPKTTTDTNIWYRRAKHLVTTPASASTITATAITIDATTASQVYAGTDDTGDLVVLHNIPANAGDAVATWCGRATAVSAGQITLQPISTYNWTFATNQTVVEIFGQPWVPIMSDAEMTALRTLLADKMTPGDKGPSPIRCTTPSVTMDSDNQHSWLAWSVNADPVVTRNGKKDSVPFSYIAYKYFDPKNPAGGSYQWVAPKTQTAQTDSAITPTVREKPVFMAGVGPFTGMVFYEGAAAGMRRLYYATTSTALLSGTAAQKADWKTDQDLTILNKSFVGTGRPQAWAKTVGGTTYINLVFQGRRGDGNIDIYSGCLKISGTDLSLMPMPAVTNEQLSSTGSSSFSSSSLAWMGTPTIKLTLKNGGLQTLTCPFINETDLKNLKTVYTLGNGTVQTEFNPYLGTVKLTQIPTGDTITSVTIDGTPRLCRLTSDPAADTNPTIAIDDRITPTNPLVWIFWDRQLTDLLGTRVYFKTCQVPDPTTTATFTLNASERILPMDLSAQDGSIAIGRLDAATPSLWVLSTASRSIYPPYPDYAARAVTGVTGVDTVKVNSVVPFQIGMSVIVYSNAAAEYSQIRNITGINSTTSELTFDKSVTVRAGEPIIGVQNQFTQHDLFMQVLDEPATN
ncbi:MAG TPA: hypothetical protein VHV83_19680, partial [Armatimonadota bacterium]|nr:hypothetical protein [Armatimonadota bacterium]